MMEIYNWALDCKSKVSTFISRLERLKSPVISERQKIYLEIEIRNLRNELAEMKVPLIK